MTLRFQLNSSRAKREDILLSFMHVLNETCKLTEWCPVQYHGSTYTFPFIILNLFMHPCLLCSTQTIPVVYPQDSDWLWCHWLRPNSSDFRVFIFRTSTIADASGYHTLNWQLLVIRCFLVLWKAIREALFLW